MISSVSSESPSLMMSAEMVAMLKPPPWCGKGVYTWASGVVLFSCLVCFFSVCGRLRLQRFSTAMDWQWHWQSLSSAQHSGVYCLVMPTSSLDSDCSSPNKRTDTCHVMFRTRMKVAGEKVWWMEKVRLSMHHFWRPLAVLSPCRPQRLLQNNACIDGFPGP